VKTGERYRPHGPLVFVVVIDDEANDRKLGIQRPRDKLREALSSQESFQKIYLVSDISPFVSVISSVHVGNRKQTRNKDTKISSLQLKIGAKTGS